MNEYGRPDPNTGMPDGVAAGNVAQGVGTALRLMGTLLGLATMVIGLVLALKVFAAVHGGLRDPDAVGARVEQWTDALAGEEPAGGAGIDPRLALMRRSVAVAALGGGAIVLAWIALAVLVTGAKIISVTTGDKEAIKRLLKHAFGSMMKPKSGSQEPGVGGQ